MAEGGQRCASHTRARLTKKSDALRVAVEAGDADALMAARSEWEDAAAQYASTVEGQASMAATRDAARESGDLHTEALMTSLLHRGEAIRSANRDAASMLSVAQMATGTDPGPGAGGPGALPVVTEQPYLGEPAALTRAMDALDAQITETSQDIEAVRWSHTSAPVTPDQLLSGMQERRATVTDPNATSNALFSAVRSQPTFLGAMPIMREGASSQDSVYALHKSLRAAEVSVLNTALGHPACDDQTRLDILNDSVQAQMRITDAETVRTTIIEHPATSDAVLDKAIVRDSTAQSSRLSPTGWEKVRRARLNRPGLAIYAAVHDDDPMERAAAFDQVVGMPLQMVSESDRAYLASTLHRMPTNEATKKILATSLADHAREYGDDAERESTYTRLSASPGVGESIAARAHRRNVPAEQPTRRRFGGPFGVGA